MSPTTHTGGMSDSSEPGPDRFSRAEIGKDAVQSTAEAAARTAPMVHRAMSGSAVCRMKPSACSPVSLSAFGPYAAIQISSLPSRTHGMRSGWPCSMTSFPSAAP